MRKIIKTSPPLLTLWIATLSVAAPLCGADDIDCQITQNRLALAEDLAKPLATSVPSPSAAAKKEANTLFYIPKPERSSPVTPSPKDTQEKKENQDNATFRWFYPTPSSTLEKTSNNTPATQPKATIEYR